MLIAFSSLSPSPSSDARSPRYRLSSVRLMTGGMALARESGMWISTVVERMVSVMSFMWLCELLD
jgi:hypothetical protein